jgi:import receptor subunit TOM20
MKYLQMGETLLQKGPSAYEQVAVCYFRALKVYPDPMNLMMALEQSLPKLVMEKIMHMMASDVGDADGLRLTELADDELE